MRTSRTAPCQQSCFAQPSGLATDGKTLYRGRQRDQRIRSCRLDGSGAGEDAGGQGPLRLRRRGRRWATGASAARPRRRLPRRQSCMWPTRTTTRSRCSTPEADCARRSWAASAKAGWPPLFNEPGGISYAGGKLYVADTNAHRIRVVDLKTKTVSTLGIAGSGTAEGERKTVNLVTSRKRKAAWYIRICCCAFQEGFHGFHCQPQRWR